MNAIPHESRWVIKKDDGSILRWLDREAVWRSAVAAEAYIEYMRTPKPTMRGPMFLTIRLRKKLKREIAARHGVTLSEMMANT